MLKLVFKICHGHLAVGDCDHHRRLYRQSLHQCQARRADAAAVSSADPKKAASKAIPSPPSDRPISAIFPSRRQGEGDFGEAFRKVYPTKVCIDKSAVEKPADKATDKADRPAETASIPPIAPRERRGRYPPPQPREKAAVKTAPAAAPAAEPVVAAPNTVPAGGTRQCADANDLARAAIERLRGADRDHIASPGSSIPRNPPARQLACAGKPAVL